MITRIPLLLSLPALTLAAQSTPLRNNVVTITVTDSGYQAPDTIPAGFTTVRVVNKGNEPHMAHLVRLDSGRTVEEFVKAYGEAVRTVGPRPAWATRYGGTGAAPHREKSTLQYLEPGTYAMICLLSHSGGNQGNLHFMTGMVRPLVVRASDGAAPPRAARKATDVIRLVDYAFVMNRPLTAGRHVIRVESRGTLPHEIGMFKLAPGKTAADLQAWARNPQGPMPVTEESGGVGALAPSLDAYFEIDLTPGEYVLFCFVTAPDGRPHTEHGMIQQFHID
jgi:hypothetical protein